MNTPPLRQPCPPGVCICRHRELLADAHGDRRILLLTRHEERRLLERLENIRELADLQRLQPAILLLDLNLGERSGLELLEQVQLRKLPVRTIVLTPRRVGSPVADALRLAVEGQRRRRDDAQARVDATTAAVTAWGLDAMAVALEAWGEADEGERAA